MNYGLTRRLLNYTIKNNRNLIREQKFNPLNAYQKKMIPCELCGKITAQRQKKRFCNRQHSSIFYQIWVYGFPYNRKLKL